MSLMNVLGVAGSALSAQSQRLNTVASNLANADSVAGPDGVAYRSRQVVFRATPEDSGAQRVAGKSLSTGVRVVDVVEDDAPVRRIHDPSHPMADAEGYVTHSNVNVVEEMVNMISASRSYQNNVEVMNTAQQLAMKTLQIGQ